MMNLCPTPHAVQRAKERTGWCQRTLNRMLERIFYDGLTSEDCSRRLRVYLADIMYALPSRFARIYGEHVFIFARENDPNEVALITILLLPADLRPVAHRDRELRSLASA